MAESYVFKGSKKRPYDKTARVVLEGSSVDPKRWIDRDGDPVELSEEEVELLRSQGWTIQKVSTPEGEEGSDEPTRADQLEAQRPPTSEPGPVNPASGSTPRGRK